jgi:NADH:ubiquinone oxidoreductase subunit 6 (subunit J)|tara:strand:+ start:7589 stop:8236 length:648 start_codon:yes stop_codon:yes gene_type:complete
LDYQLLSKVPLPQQFDRLIVTGGIVTSVFVILILTILLILKFVGFISYTEVFFWLISSGMIIGALASVFLKNIVHAVFSLLAPLLGIVAIYLFLGSEFLALAQLLIYGGGVVILLLFALMMTDVQDNPVVIDGSQKPVGFIIAVLIGFVLLYSIFTADIEIATPSSLSLADLGSNIFTQFLIPFLLLGILLDIALTGALLNGKKHKNLQSSDSDE